LGIDLKHVYDTLPVFAQNWACTWAGYQRARLRFTPYFEQTLSAWKESAHWPLEKLHELQRDRLFALLERARRYSPHYRNLPPPSATTDAHEAIAETLAKLPVLEKETYREQPEHFLCRDIPPQELLRGKTSGTTGSALPLWFTRRTLGEEYACIWRQRRSFGVERSDPNLTFNGQIVVPAHATQPPYWRKNYATRQTLFSIYHMSPENLPAYIEAIHHTPAAWIQGYPSAIFLVARTMFEQNRPAPPGRFVAVFPSSESLLAFQREIIEKAFNAPVRDRYGVSEFAVSMTECDKGRLHVDMEFGIVEVEVQETTEEYERGPLLVTGFANNATPFIRYRVGDVGTRSRKPCPCGRAGDNFLDIDGRIEDYVVTPDGHLIGRLDHIFKEQYDVAEAQILQQRAETIEVFVVKRSTFNENSEQQFLREIRSRLGTNINVRIRYVDTIPREPNGKFRAVKSFIGQGMQPVSAVRREAPSISSLRQGRLQEITARMQSIRSMVGAQRIYAALPVFAQNWMCTWEGYRRARTRFNPHFHRTLAAWETSVRWPREQLDALQRQRLETLINRARLYTEHYRDLPPPAAAKDAKEAIAQTLAQIPVLEREGYRAAPEAFVCRDIPKQQLMHGKTSGTTGKALPLWFTRETLAEEFASVWRQRHRFGVEIGDPNLTFNGHLIVATGNSHPPFWRKNNASHQTLFSIYHMSPEYLPAYVDAVHAAPANWVQGYPSAIFLVARAMLDAGKPAPKGRFKGIFTSSETLLSFQRGVIEAAFNAPIHDRYGVAEFTASMTECEQRRLHVDVEFCIVEVEVQEATEDFERGPLLVTGLANYATPFLRYRVGDVGIRARTPCPCGRAGDTFLSIEGRLEDYVTTPDGRLIGLLDHIFDDQIDIAEAQIFQETPLAIEMRVVRRPTYNETSEKQLEKAIRARLGQRIKIEMRYVNQIPREPNGKFRLVKSYFGRDVL